MRGIFDLTNAEEFLERTLEINDFNKLKIPIYVAATSLNDHSGVLFGPGSMDHIPLSKAIVASCCIPVLFRPVKIEGKYYVDGEIKRPLSTEAAIKRGADVVIVSDTYGSKSNSEKIGMFGIASEVINMMFEDKSIRSIAISREKYPDKQIILISPKVGDVPMFRSYSYEALVKSGYDAANQILQEVKNGVEILDKISNLVPHGYYDKSKDMIVVHFFSKDSDKPDIMAYLKRDMSWDIREVVEEKSTLLFDREVVEILHKSVSRCERGSQFDKMVRDILLKIEARIQKMLGLLEKEIKCLGY